MKGLYPKNLRKSIKELIKVNLDFDSLSIKTAHLLINYNVFIKLPNKYYDFAIELDVNNILAFDYKTVKINDLKKLIYKLPHIPECFADVVKFHKKYLLIDRHIVFKLVESTIIDLSDIRTILDNYVMTPVEIALINSDMIIPGTHFTLEDIKTVFERTGIDNTLKLYERIDTSIYNILLMEEEFSIPPVHSSIYQLMDINKAIALIKKYHDKDIITHVNGTVKSHNRFLKEMIDLVLSKLPNVLPFINKWIATQLASDKLLTTFGIYFYVLFEWIDVPLYMDKYYFNRMSDEETTFICKYIDIYKKKSELFVNTLKLYLYYSNNVHTQKIFEEQTSKRIKKDYMIKESFKYLDNEANTSVLLNDFKYNYAISKYILSSEASDSIKLEAFKILSKQKVCTDNCTCMELGTLYSVILRFPYNNKYIPCDYEVLGYSYDISDAGLAKLTYRLSSAARKGMIDIRFLHTNCLWSPVMYLLEDTSKVSFSRFMKAVKNINIENVKYFNKNEYNSIKLEHINDIDIYKLLEYERVKLYGINYIKKVILANTIFEYVITILIIRLKISSYNYRQFIELLIYKCLKGFEIPVKTYKGVYVNEMNICLELERLMNESVIPFITHGLVIKLLINIFTNLNGIGKHSSGIRFRKDKIGI
ncbi:hypothetical protein ChPV114 [Cheloniid poxvirus 1]|nr:hypothetical protein ChPV114 [Cheloniid poxvirus 1]